MCPAVAHFAQFADHAALGVAQGVAEDRVPVVPHNDQESVRVQMGFGLFLCIVRAQALSGPAGPQRGFHLPLHEGLEALAQQFQGFPDPIIVCDRHPLSPSPSVLCRFAVRDRLPVPLDLQLPQSQ